MNIMDLEKIEHEEAQKVFEGTEYEWTDMMDFESCKDLVKELRSADETQAREAFKHYFETLLIDVRFYENE